MTPNELIISTAFLSALAQLDESLPVNIQVQLNEIGKALANDSDSVSRLDVIAESYYPLDILYQRELARLEQGVGERNKSLPPLPLPTQPTAELTNMVIATLNSNDSMSTVKGSENLTKLERIWRSIMGGYDDR